MINQVSCIKHFIQNDQMQSRRVDDLLPFTKTGLLAILGDNYAAELFHEKQWEFSVPAFSGHIIPRFLECETILPYLTDKYLTGGGFGSVYLVDIYLPIGRLILRTLHL
jgi:hypothetical protein